MGWFDTLKDFAGSVYGGAKNIVGALASTASKWMEGEYHAPDFVGGGAYQYCGAGTKLRGQAPINAVDSACRTHDYDYERLAQQRGSMPEGQFNRLIRESDQRLVNSIEQSGQSDLGALMSKWGIKAKMGLEDLGVLNPSRFVV